MNVHLAKHLEGTLTGFLPVVADNYFDPWWFGCWQQPGAAVRPSKREKKIWKSPRSCLSISTARLVFTTGIAHDAVT